jgi:hypothetical protein
MTSITGGEPVITRLAAGEGEPLFVVDFDDFTDAPNLSVLLADQADDRSVYQVDPIGLLSGRRYLPLPDLAAAAAEAFAACGDACQQIFVVGYCSAAALALRIGRLIAPSRNVTVLLARPAWPDDQLVTAMFDHICEHIGRSARQCPCLDGDPSEVLGAMTELLGEELAGLADQMGLGQSPEPFGDLLDRYHAWLAFLLACRADPERDIAGGIAVRSLGHEGSPPAELARLVLAHVAGA